MKVTLATLTCLLLLTGLGVPRAVKIHREAFYGEDAMDSANDSNASNASNTRRRRGGICADNRFALNASDTYNFSGAKHFENVFPDSAFQNLQADPDFKIGRSWKLQMKVTSNDSSDREFSFSGSILGYLNIVIPAWSKGDIVSSVATVESTLNHTHFEYRGPGFVENVVVTDICLRPAYCSEAFNGTCPEAHVPQPEGTYGGTEKECCEPLMCIDWNCSSDTKYKLKSNADCIVGASDSACCEAIPCDSDLCNATIWEPKPGTGWIGSTPEQCCNPRMCAKYQCSDSKTWGRLPDFVTTGNQTTPRTGSTDAECCYEMWCGEFDCHTNTKYKNESEQNATRGHSYALCCDVQSCSDYNCSVSTQWLHLPPNNANGARYNGSTDAECCSPQLCRRYTCQNVSAYHINSKLGEQARGSTDEECCERRQCKEYTCSDPSKYTKMASHIAADSGENEMRLGYSDVECCEPIFCDSVPKICQPCTKWTAKQTFNTTLGSTNDVCCDKVMCSNYTCKQPTKYRLKGNYAFLQGNSDKECCDPIYCSNYHVTLKTKFEKIYEEGRLGSTDQECSKILYCANYTCSQGGQIIDGTLWGSTDCECCNGDRKGCPQ